MTWVDEVLRSNNFSSKNPDLSRDALHQAFKRSVERFSQHWRQRSCKSGNRRYRRYKVLFSDVSAAANQRLHMNDFATKAEFRAYKSALKEQNALNQINNSIQQTESGRVINVNQGFSLDLTSAVETITLGNNLFKQRKRSQSMLVDRKRLFQPALK